MGINKARLPKDFNGKDALEWFQFIADNQVRLSPCLTRKWSAQAFTDHYGILAVRGEPGPIEALKKLKANIEQHEKGTVRRGPPRR